MSKLFRLVRNDEVAEYWLTGWRLREMRGAGFTCMEWTRDDYPVIPAAARPMSGFDIEAAELAVAAIALGDELAVGGKA